MAVNSNINPNFPLPGVDQSSKGFRDNFAATKTEIENLQGKTIQITGSLISNPVQIGSGNSTVVIPVQISLANVGAAGSNLSVQYNDNGAIAGSQMYIFGSNVGINTNTPSVDLDVVGNARVSSSTGNTHIDIGSNLRIRSSQFTANIIVSNVSALTIDKSTQYVGINTLPTARFEVSAGSNSVISIFGTNAASSNSDVRFTTNASASTIGLVLEQRVANKTGGMRIDTGGNISIHVNGANDAHLVDSTRAITVTTTGNVGIGNTNPAHRLSVSGNISISNTSVISGIKYADGSFQNTASIAGPTGPIGATGNVGATGPTGPINPTALSASNITVTSTTTDATFYPVFAEALTGNIGMRDASGLTFNPSSNTLTISGNASIGSIGINGNIAASSASAPSITFGNIQTGFWGRTQNTIDVSIGGVNKIEVGYSSISLGSDMNVGWVSSSSTNGNIEIGISRQSSSNLEINDGNLSVYRDLVLRNLVSSGNVEVTGNITATRNIIVGGNITATGNITTSNNIIFSDSSVLSTANLPSAVLAMPGNIVASTHNNKIVYLTGIGNLNIANTSFGSSNSCIIRNNTSNLITITTSGYSNATIGAPIYGYTGIIPSGIATIIVGTTGGSTVICDVRGDLG
jgi:filamentous hemagglutinin